MRCEKIYYFAAISPNAETVVDIRQRRVRRELAKMGGILGSQLASVSEHEEYYLDPRRDVRAYVGGSCRQTTRMMIPDSNISNSALSPTSYSTNLRDCKLYCSFQPIHFSQCSHHVQYTVFICPIAIAYSMGQIIKSVCICQCICLSVCEHSHDRIS